MFKRHFFFGKKVLGHVPDPGQGQREDRSKAGQDYAEGRDKGLAQALAHPGPTGLCFPKAQSGSFCGRMFLARLPQVFPAAEAKPCVLEDED